MVIMIVTFLVVVLAFCLMLLACLGRFFPMTQKMAYRFVKSRVKKVAFIVSLVQFFLLGFGILLFAIEHRRAFSKDWRIENGFCMGACSKFLGSGFGPGAGWYLACMCTPFFQKGISSFLFIFKCSLLRCCMGFHTASNNSGGIVCNEYDAQSGEV